MIRLESNLFDLNFLRRAAPYFLDTLGKREYTLNSRVGEAGLASPAQNGEGAMSASTISVRSSIPRRMAENSLSGWSSFQGAGPNETQHRGRNG